LKIEERLIVVADYQPGDFGGIVEVEKKVMQLVSEFEGTGVYISGLSLQKRKLMMTVGLFHCQDLIIEKEKLSWWLMILLQKLIREQRKSNQLNLRVVLSWLIVSREEEPNSRRRATVLFFA